MRGKRTVLLPYPREHQRQRSSLHISSDVISGAELDGTTCGDSSLPRRECLRGGTQLFVSQRIFPKRKLQVRSDLGEDFCC